MREIDDLKTILKDKKVSKESLKRVKEINETWEKQREEMGANVLTQKDRIIQLEIKFTRMIQDMKENNKNIKTFFFLFTIQILIDTLILLALFKVK